MPDSTSDEYLMDRLNEGDQSAFETLYERHSPRLYGLAVQITGDRSGAEEVLQDTFFQLWRKSTQFDSNRGPLVAWLVTMTRNKAISHTRVTEKKVNCRFCPESLVAIKSKRTPSPLDDIIVQEIISTALATMPGPTREVFKLAYFDGLTCQEIAIRTNSPLGTTKSRLRSALKSLKRIKVAA